MITRAEAKTQIQKMVSDHDLGAQDDEDVLAALYRELEPRPGEVPATKDQLIDLAYSLSWWSMAKFVLDQLPEDGT